MSEAHPPVRHTHAITRDGDLITKTYRSWSRAEPVREWTSLRHLAETAPGLAAEPDAAGLTDVPPWVRMQLLPGEPLPGIWAERRLDRLADAMGELWSVAVPPDLTPIELHRVGYWVDLFVRTPPPSPGPLLAAYELVGRWLHSDAVEALLATAELTVLGQGDPQVGNMLYDDANDRIGLVDFEDAGPSEPAFELANFAEHLGTRGTGLDRLVDRFAVDRDRFDGYRRLQTSFWFLHLLPRRADRAADVAELADRVTRLLG